MGRRTAPSQLSAAWLRALALLLVGGCQTHGEPPEISPQSARTETVETDASPSAPATAIDALEAYLDCWRQKDLAAYDALLHPGFLFLPAEDSADDEFWRREQEMKMARDSFRPDTPTHDYTATVLSEQPSTMVPSATALEAALEWQATNPQTGETSAVQTKTMVFHFLPAGAGTWQLRALEEPRSPAPRSDIPDPVLE